MKILTSVFRCDLLNLRFQATAVAWCLSIRKRASLFRRIHIYGLSLWRPCPAKGNWFKLFPHFTSYSSSMNIIFICFALNADAGLVSYSDTRLRRPTTPKSVLCRWSPRQRNNALWGGTDETGWYTQLTSVALPGLKFVEIQIRIEMGGVMSLHLEATWVPVARYRSWKLTTATNNPNNHFRTSWPRHSPMEHQCWLVTSHLRWDEGFLFSNITHYYYPVRTWQYGRRNT